MDPKVFLLDQPFSALDALTRATLQDDLPYLAGTRKTVVMITNDVEEAIPARGSYLSPLTPGPGATLGPDSLACRVRARGVGSAWMPSTRRHGGASSSFSSKPGIAA